MISKSTIVLKKKNLSSFKNDIKDFYHKRFIKPKSQYELLKLLIDITRWARAVPGPITGPGSSDFQKVLSRDQPAINSRQG